MGWRGELLDQLAAAMPCGYKRGAAPATEPVSLACMALSVHDRRETSREALQWLGSIQNDDGRLGPMSDIDSPCWPTSLAVLASGYAGDKGCADVLGFSGSATSTRSNDLADNSSIDAQRAVAWLLTAKGEVHAGKSFLAHDSTIVGWPWVLGTHSWVEPTALAVLALKANGHSEHSRTKEGVRLLIDRLLPGGGCNYGNTIVLGQTLSPHVQPTGLALLALHGEADRDGRIARSLAYLERELSGDSAAASLAYGLWALARYGKAPRNAGGWLAAAARRKATLESPLRMALLLLADAALETDRPGGPK